MHYTFNFKIVIVFSQAAARDAEGLLSKAEARSTEEIDTWVSSNEAVESLKLQVEIESDVVNGAREALNDSIQDSIEDDLREKDSLCKARDVLNDELQRLLALVRQKEEEIAENDSKIQAVEQKISQVVSGFQDLQSSVNQKYDALQSGLSQLNSEMDALTIKKKEIDELLNLEVDKATKLKQLAKISSDEAETYQSIVGLRTSLMSVILKSREDKVRLAKTEEELSEDVLLHQQQVSAARTSLQVI